MSSLLRIDALNVTEFNGPSFPPEERGYALWFFLDNDQSCFVELQVGKPLRQPEFIVRDGHHTIQLELFRRKEAKSNQRVLVGEAQIPAKFLLSAPENHLVVEIMRHECTVAATVLLRIEKYARKGRSLSLRSRSSASPSVSHSITTSADEQAPAALSGMHADLIHSSSASAFLIGLFDLAGSIVNDLQTVVHTSQPSLNSSSSSILPLSAKIDFIEKFTLTGSPITVFKSDISGSMSKLMYLDVPAEDAGPEMETAGEAESSAHSDACTGNGTESISRLQTNGKRAALSDLSATLAGERMEQQSLGSPTEVKGLVSLEVVAAQNLPREKRILRVHFQNNPFVVISFGKQSFKTKVIKRTVNPVWKERLFFTIKESEANYYIMFSVYDYDKISYNSCIGMTNIKASTLLDHPNEIQKLALTLRLTKPNGFGDACLLVKGCFISYDVLRKNFWEVLAKQYDHDDNGKLNRIELSTMLESIGSTLSEDTIDAILRKLDVDAEGEIDISNIVASLEDLTVQASLPEHAEENIALVRTCPICNKNLDEHREDIDVITHLAVCAAKDSGKLDRFVMGGFLTEDYASRKWFMKILSFMSFGGYRIGKNNGNILVQDRKTGKLMEEKMPTYIRLGIRWMHQHTASTRAVDTYMVRQIFQTLTLKQGRKFDDPASVKSIPDFIRYHKINIDEIQDPIPSFRTFNEFFYRKLRAGVRKLASPDPRVCVSPADCRINCFENIDEAMRLWIKGANFSVANLLKDDSLAEHYTGGSVVVCRLAPQDYHRFHSPVDGRINIYYRIPGTYFTVNPMAVRQNIDVYTENSRTVCLIESDHFGKVALVAIGAMMVGSIVITSVSGERLSRMDEVGYFAFGGSTIVVLFPPNTVTYDSDLLGNSREQLETLVQMGNSLGSARPGPAPTFNNFVP